MTSETASRRPKLGVLVSGLALAALAAQARETPPTASLVAALDHQDFDLLVQPAQTRRTRCAAGHSTHDNDFHD
jgi:hypothetical protein